MAIVHWIKRIMTKRLRVCALDSITVLLAEVVLLCPYFVELAKKIKREGRLMTMHASKILM